MSMIQNTRTKEERFIIRMRGDQDGPARMSKRVGDQAWVIGQVISQQEIQTQGPRDERAGQGGHDDGPALGG